MKKDPEVRYVEYDEYKQKTKKTKLIYLLPDIEFIEGNTNGEITHFLTIRYHNGSGTNIEINPEAWEEVLRRIKAGDDSKLWKLLHRWGIYRG